MKSERLFVLMIAALFLLMLLTYARFNHFEQTITRQRIADLHGLLNTLISTMKDSESRFNVYADNLAQLKERLDMAENERKELWIKYERMAKDFDNLRTNVTAASLETNKKIVELGSISVKKTKAKK